MSFIIEHEIKGNIYLYEVENKWDKIKKKTIQKRTYIGPKFPLKRSKSIRKNLDLVNKSFGNIFLLDYLSKQIGVKIIVKDSFPESYNEIMALAYYEVMEGSPFYLFPYWLDDNNLPNVKRLDSSGISGLFDILGKNESQRFDFIEKWIEHLQPVKAAFFDISSISSYSSNISFIEWGYNRDGENLPQLNLGLVYCDNKKLPINYHLYPGSIVDVTTLKNCKRYLCNFGLKDFLFILDRGFFSTSNLKEMSKKDEGINFIQPLPFSLKKAKELIKKHKRKLKNINTAFPFNKEVLNHLKSSVDFDQGQYDAHIFYNEKAEIDIRHNFLATIFEIERKLQTKKFEKLKDWINYKNNDIPEKYRDFFKWNKTSFRIEKNIRNIKAYLARAGYNILATNKTDISRDEILTYYRNKDLVEKVFDIMKNEMDSKRLRTHNDYTTAGKMFIMFISSIVYSEIVRIMHLRKLFKKYTVKELLYELKKIKINNIRKDGKPIFSEISKKQKKIFEDFKIDYSELYGM